MSSALVAGLVAGYGVALPLGPIGAYLVSLGARVGVRASAAAALGVATTDAVFAAVASLGGYALRPVLDPIAAPLTTVSAAVLLIIAIRIVLSARRASDPAAPLRSPWSPARAYLAFVVLTALNPSTLVYFSALVIGGRATGTAAGALFTIGVAAASASWQLVLVCGGALFGRTLTSGRARKLLALTSAVIIATLAVRDVLA